jgi:hypothetical protein
MTIKNRRNIDKFMKVLSKTAKAIRRINKPIGAKLQDIVYDIWDMTY